MIFVLTLATMLMNFLMMYVCRLERSSSELVYQNRVKKYSEMGFLIIGTLILQKMTSIRNIWIWLKHFEIVQMSVPLYLLTKIIIDVRLYLIYITIFSCLLNSSRKTNSTLFEMIWILLFLSNTKKHLSRSLWQISSICRQQ